MKQLTDSLKGITNSIIGYIKEYNEYRKAKTIIRKDDKNPIYTCLGMRCITSEVINAQLEYTFSRFKKYEIF